MLRFKQYLWIFFVMSVWAFKHCYHGVNHKINGSAIERNYTAGYFRCYRCQDQLNIPGY
ncbi:hypothetical protein PP914_gp201 [Arthrobacter phage Qui]|jgi:hypothetical protein|uniref:Uncharacterized protein n=1 Tax=Arthrobacter phage Qui TaxID=2603260 RepID=A0A5B8WI04_9CAUD|nr:hypothetical protein PP914_gp201 [Arthrobacter phage Qui]QED11689.1 hypothetical protein SEA_QUI_201 [Arthrobacter phage Qui]QOC56520.1 hypothetical protein SEA_PAELLA_201 [Arthrobacter phage Paella]